MNKNVNYSYPEKFDDTSYPCLIRLHDKNIVTEQYQQREEKSFIKAGFCVLTLSGNLTLNSIKSAISYLPGTPNLFLEGSGQYGELSQQFLTDSNNCFSSICAALFSPEIESAFSNPCRMPKYAALISTPLLLTSYSDENREKKVYERELYQILMSRNIPSRQLILFPTSLEEPDSIKNGIAQTVAWFQHFWNQNNTQLHLGERKNPITK